jgi:MerR family transcriptional regulator, copper efflux regulator
MKLISQLSKEMGVAIATIRFYEKMGLFAGKRKPGVTSNNYLYYDDEVEEKLELITLAKSVGFTLNEIKEIIDAWYSKRITKAKKLEILDKKLAQIEIKIQELKEAKKQLAWLKKEVQQNDC